MNKLLVFNEDYADEHNVPALSVMTQEEFNIWCKKPNGTFNTEYDSQLKVYNELEDDNRTFWKMLEDKGYTLDGRGNTSAIPKTDLVTLNLEKEYRERHSYENKVNHPTRVIDCRLYANLGNGGDSFEKDYCDIYLNEEFITNNIVSVSDVSDEFMKTFNEAKLANLSLCNIFKED